MNDRPKIVACIIPILKVARVSASLEFYVGLLGFERGWLYEKDGFTMAGISRDDHAIYLCENAQGSEGTWIWIGVADIDPLYDLLRSKDVTVLLPPTNFSWAYEMRIRDPDGHVLRFGSESLAGVPVHD